ncbi:cytochrome P450 [Cupriavidus sp. amp6]|uniref:cytochrome P450 n=1 Tax=Cupriavidus sp. amp6 TaxID=388051 RepID=UPI00048A47C7|nr:cytochrome P450 [Cupriavidus sp. amp6]
MFILVPITTASNFDLPDDIAKLLVDPKTYSNPELLHSVYTWARANNPFGRAVIEGFDPFWVTTKYADVSAISRDSSLFRNGDYSVVCRPKAAIDYIISVTGSPHIVKALVQFDGDKHKKMRALAQSWFMPDSLLNLDERIRRLARCCVDKLAHYEGEVIDFSRNIALYYPLHVIMDILGIPSEDEAKMLVLTQELFGGEDPELNRGKAEVASGKDVLAKNLLAVVEDFRHYFDKLTSDKRTSPRNDIATLLSNAVVNGEPISDANRLGYYIIIATAGHDTTSSSSAIAMWALSQFPDLLPRLQADAALIPKFVDEAVRFASPVSHFMRTAAADTEIRGRTVRKGDWIMLCYGSANRDEDVFDKPFEFSIDRKEVHHLAFGTGPHICLGQHLAKMEMRILFEEMIPRLERVESAGELEMVASSFVGGPKHLPLRCFMR